MLNATALAIDNKDRHDASSLNQVPAAQRVRILSGMRWTVWLSALAIPFSFAVNLVLARVGPETLGVYGLLSLYVSLSSAFLYFGGDAVVMRFIPECEAEERGSFLLSYMCVILVIMGAWLIFAWLFPVTISVALGQVNSRRFNLVVLCFAIIPITFAMVVASLKGMLEIRTSQIIAKLLAILSLAVYAGFYSFDRPLLSSHPTPVIWSVYLGICTILAMVGIGRLVQVCRLVKLRWFLPSGFWRYAFSTQQVSMTSFFVARLDYILVVNFGGVRLLGKYVAVMSIAALVRMLSGFFMDTLLPSLTNTISARNHAGAAQVFAIHMRILFLVVVAISCGLMVTAEAATAIMGQKYSSLGGMIIFMSGAYGIASPAFGGTVLASIGRQQRAVWTNLLYLALYASLFPILWWRWQLTGAVVACGIAAVVSNTVLMVISLRVAQFLPSIRGLWLRSSFIQILVAFVALWWMPIGLGTAIPLWCTAIMTFLWLGHYDWNECKNLFHVFLPDGASYAATDSGTPSAL